MSTACNIKTNSAPECILMQHRLQAGDLVRFETRSYVLHQSNHDPFARGYF